MVYFTCGACGEQVKKPQVEKHYTQKCRNCSVLTCIDCLKDFYGDEYKSHNQCMSEAQRYSKEGREGWDPTVGQGNKGEKKQQQWIDKLRNLLDTASDIDPSVRRIIDTILDHENIPRKRPKFVNFVKNIMRNKAQMSDIDKTWDLFSQALAPAKEPEKPAEPVLPAPVEEPQEPEKKKKKKKKSKDEETEPLKETTENGQQQGEGKEKKKKKRKLEETMEVEEDEPSEPTPKKSKFDWHQTITSVLAKKGNEMKLNKLKKKCISEFFAHNENAHQTMEEVGAKFDKKIKKKPYKILKDRVLLANVESEENVAPENGEEMEVEPVNGNAASKPMNGSAAAKTDLSFNKWEAANLGNNAQTEKFRRLMGIKTDKPPEAIDAKKRDDKKIFRDLEDGFEKARQSHFKSKGKGLGFS